MPSWKRPYTLASMSPKRDLGESHHRATSHCKNEEDFKLFLSLYLSQGNVLIWPLILRTTYSMKRERGAISSKEIFNRVRRKHIHGCDFSEAERCTVELVWAQAHSAERLANPISALVTGTDNFHLDLIRSHESALVE